MFIDRLNFILKKRNMTGSELCKRLNIPNGNYTHWKKNTPNSKTIKEIAKILDVTIDWLLENSDEPIKEEEIISFYRKADDRGKDRIYKTAKDEAEHAEQVKRKEDPSMSTLEDNVTPFSKEINPFA